MTPWLTRSLRVSAMAAAALAVQPLATGAQGPGFGPPGLDPMGRGQGPGRGPGPMQQERKVVAQFDKNGDKRLDTAERKDAREWLATQPAMGFGGRGRFGGGETPAETGRRLTHTDVKSYGSSAPVYDSTALRTLFLQFESSDWEQELAAFNNTDVEVPATATVDGVTYKDVGVHFRGMSSYFMVPPGRKRSLNVSFDFVNARQSLGGYKTLNLLNANGDPTFLRGVLYTAISSEYVPTPKMNYMRVVINGENWGVYLNAQQFNKDFTRDYFKSTKGTRWKVPGSPGGRAGFNYVGDSPEHYKRLYVMTGKDNAKAWADLIRVFKVLNETPADTLEAALAPMLDVEGTLKFLAVDVALANSDGFWTRASDYSIYQDEKGIFHVIPHDVNEGLGAEEGRGRRGGFPGGPGGFGGRVPFGGGGPELDPLVGLTDSNKALRSKLLAIPAFRAKYLGYVRDIAQHWLDWKTLGPTAERYRALIADDVKADTRKLYPSEAFDAGFDELKSFVDRRRAYLLAYEPPR